MKIFFSVSQMIWMQNLIEMKKNAIVMVLEVLIMSQTFSLDLNLLLNFFFPTGLILNTVPILVPEQITKISTVLKLIRLRYILHIYIYRKSADFFQNISKLFSVSVSIMMYHGLNRHIARWIVFQLVTFNLDLNMR